MTGPTHLSHPTLWAVSDLHVHYEQNRAIIESITARHPGDWLIIAGDIGDPADVEWLWSLLRPRFAVIAWVPGNHDLWVRSSGSAPFDSEGRYDELVALSRRFDVLTPEDDWAIVPTVAGPRHLVLLMTLYDHSFLPPGYDGPESALRAAHELGIVFTDQFLLRVGAHGTIAQWSRSRVASAARRLDALGDARTILVNHYPLTARPVGWYREPFLGLWSGTTATQDWPWRYHASAVVYGHQHIPHHYVEREVDFHEVSLGYPRERRPEPVWRPRAICALT